MTTPQPGRIVLVTGSSLGIGLATAVAFAASGDTVVATMRDPGRAGPLQEAAAAGAGVEIRQLDVTDDASVASCINGVHQDFGRLASNTA